MSLGKFKPPELLVLAGGALMLVFGLLRWFSWEIPASGGEIPGKSNAFDYLLTGVLPWLLIVGAAVVTLLLATGTLRREGVPWALVILAATVLGAVLVIVRLIIGYDPDPSGDVDVDVSRGIGIWISALGAILAAVGAFLGYQSIAAAGSVTPQSGRPQPEREIPPPTP